MIYFAQLATGAIKIGTTVDLTARMTGLKSHYGESLALLGTMPGGRKEEREIHHRFAHLRLGHTEQFRPAADLMEYIGRPLLVSQNPDAAVVTPGRGVSVQLDPDVVKAARLVSALTEKPMATLISDLVRPLLAKMEREELAKRTKPKGGGR